MKIKKSRLFVSLLPCLLASLLLSACGASTTNSDLDKARFALDNCSTTDTASCTTAISNADAVLAGDPNNADAALVKSSAVATSGGINILSMMSKVAKTTDTAEKFLALRSAIADTVSIADLRSSITALTGITAPTDSTTDIYRDYHFQLGILQALEAFIRPSKLAQPTSGATVDITATTAITDAENTIAKEDFIGADTNLRKGGMESDDTGWELVTAIRNNYGAIKNAATAADGFTTAKLRAMMRCQLNTAAVIATLTTNAEFPGTAITKCSDFGFTGYDNTVCQ